ncbi:Phthiocerol synthesis polyketide synthase type I, partial [Paramuricea clavata]
MDLDFFIMFSSISGVLGNVGQVAYAAANSFMDQLCEYRRHKLGLPALSVNWGPIIGAGVLERNAVIASILEKHGFYTLHYTTAIEFLKRVLLENTNEAQVCLSAMNWPVYLQNHASPRLQMIREKTLVAIEKNKLMTLEDLALQPLEFRVNYVQEYIKRLISSWSGADVAELDVNVGLYKYGIDSISATNMKLQIKNNIGAIFETHYFIQPNTSCITIINDILEQIDKKSSTCDENDSSENDNQSYQTESFMLKNDIEREEEAAESNGQELQTVRTNKEKVIPLYAPEDAVVKVFMVHGSQRSALALATFALGFQQQINVALYGIGMDDVSRKKSDYGSVLALAQKYTDLIQKIQPRGPYYLAGYSFGGTVAYEMASELKRNNETVAMVFMVDTYAWFPKALTNCREYVTTCTEQNLKSTKKLVVVSKEGTHPDPRRVALADLLNAPQPNNAHEVRSFLGMANYNSKCIRDFATLTAPLRDLTKKDEHGLSFQLLYNNAKCCRYNNETHLAIEKTKCLVHEKIWFPQIDKRVKDTIAKCNTSQAVGQANLPEPLRMIEMPELPWRTVHIDFYGPLPSSECLLVAVDRYSRFPEVEIVHSTRASTVIPKLDKMFSVHGIPDTIISDNGPPFNGDEYARYLKALGIQAKFSTPYWPQGNATVERFMRPLGKALKTATLEGRPWKQELNRFLLQYRTTPHCTTRVPPSELLFNRLIKGKLPLINSKKIVNRHKKACDNEKTQQERNREYANQRRNTKQVIYKLEIMYWLDKKRIKNKLTVNFNHKPYKIIKTGSEISTQ